MEAEKARKLEDALLKRVRVLQSTNRKANVLRLARAGKKSLGITGNEWDQGSMVLVCMNGVINLKDGNFRNGRPEDYVKTIAPVKWEGLDAMAPTWGNFLEDVFEADQDLISYVQRLFGYAITGKTTEHIYPIFWGEGRNGKGTLFETIGHVLGDMAGPIEAEMILMQKFTRHAGGPASDIMALRGKRIVWASETDEGRKLSAGRLKWLTGGDTLTGRAPYGRRQISFKPTHTLLLMTNSKPHAPANDFALWSRIHLIPFNKAFVSDPKGTDQKKADPELPSRLRAEACGILAWLVQGCLEWQRQGLNPPETVKVATQGYRQEEDLMGLFIEDRCEVSESATVKAGALYKTYQAWCGDMGHKPMSGTAFGKEMKTRFDFVKERHIRYIGIGLLEN
jgi:putative DNA primase/helicase